jgi:flagellar hook-basal body complex protein FliE
MVPMQSSFVSHLNTVNSAASLFDAQMSTPSTVPAFSGLIKDAITSVQSLEDQASSAVEGLISGRGVDIHQAMIATQKADLSFEMALAVRNKAVAAYQQLMQMQF